MRLKLCEESENYIVRNRWLLPTISGFLLMLVQYVIIPALDIKPFLPDQLIVFIGAVLVCMGGIQNLIASTLTAKVGRWVIIFAIALILIAYYQHVTQAN